MLGSDEDIAFLLRETKGAVNPITRGSLLLRKQGPLWPHPVALPSLRHPMYHTTSACPNPTSVAVSSNHTPTSGSSVMRDERL